MIKTIIGPEKKALPEEISSKVCSVLPRRASHDGPDSINSEPTRTPGTRTARIWDVDISNEDRGSGGSHNDVPD